MEGCGVSNRVRHWKDSSTKAGPSCFWLVVETKSVFSIAVTERRAAWGSKRTFAVISFVVGNACCRHTADAGDFAVGGKYDHLCNKLQRLFDN